MSKLIVEMEMPRDCPMCPMAHWNKLDEFTGCEVAPGKLFVAMRDKSYAESTCRPDWCPIKGVLPDEHGDLIDRDAYLNLLESYIESKRGVCENKEFIVALQAISKQIKCVKAVIAAERKDDD